MTLVPELRRLARACTGNPEQALVQLLQLRCDDSDSPPDAAALLCRSDAAM